MENTNETFDKVLQKLKKLGYAKLGNPKLDLNLADAFAKIRILSALSFNAKFYKNKCIMEGIENIKLEDIKIANQLGLRVKLLGISEIINGQLFETVHPCLVSKKTYIGNVTGVMNAVITEGKPVGEYLQGEGAGPESISPLHYYQIYCSILRGNTKYPFGISSNKEDLLSHFNDKYTNSLYLRFEVKDKQGVLSLITNRLANYKISVKE